MSEIEISEPYELKISSELKEKIKGILKQGTLEIHKETIIYYEKGKNNSYLSSTIRSVYGMPDIYSISQIVSSMVDNVEVGTGTIYKRIEPIQVWPKHASDFIKVVCLIAREKTKCAWLFATMSIQDCAGGVIEALQANNFKLNCEAGNPNYSGKPFYVYSLNMQDFVE
jgi:hypothetical protein